LVENRSEGIDTSFPEESTIRLNDLESSWSFFLALETMSGLDGWQIIDTLGRPWIELPERLQEDLLTWRWLLGIAEGIRKKQNA